MFRVTFITKDEKLGVALKALLGVAVDKPEYEPVHDAAIKNGRLVSEPLTPFGVAQQLPRQFKTGAVAALMRRLHRPAGQTAVAARIREMVGAKLIRKGRKRGHYERVAK